MHRMTDFEALMWTIERDPRLSNAFANVTLLDRPPDIDRLHRRLQRASIVIPRLRQRVVSTPGGLAPPAWRIDPDFDVANHVDEVTLPAPGSAEQLDELVVGRAQAVFDPVRPLWEFVVIHGLEGDRTAILQRFHHSITDGEGGIRMSAEFLDLEEGAPEPEPLDVPEDTAGQAQDPLAVALDSVGHATRRGLGAARRAMSSAAESMADPSRLVGLRDDVATTAQAIVRQVRTIDRPLSPLWSARSLDRGYCRFELPFDRSKRAAEQLGGSLNDFFVAGAVLAAGRVHRQAGQPVEELRMAMPVSTRSDRSMGGNQFSLAQVVVPVGSDDPKAAFTALSSVLQVAKRDRALRLVSDVAGLLNLVPAPLLVRAGALAAGSIDFTTSNVRAAPFALWLAGARLEANYPVGPLANTAFNLTVMSYNGSLFMGLHVDTAAVGPPEPLRDTLVEAYDDLCETAGV